MNEFRETPQSPNLIKLSIKSLNEEWNLELDSSLRILSIKSLLAHHVSERILKVE